MSMRVLAAAVASVVLAGGCAATPAQQADSGLSVVVSAYPLQFLTERILAGAGVVTNLTPPGAEPHDLELTARQMATMATADAVVYLPGFQTAVDDGIATAQPKLVVDAEAGLQLLPASTDAEGNPTTATHDPHVWQSPANMATMARTISSALRTARPDLAAVLQANTEALVADLDDLDAAFRQGLATCGRREFITSHAAFAYLADRYQLVQIPVSGLDPGVEPTAARIAEVQQLARSYKVTTIFFETLASNAVATSIARDLGLATAVLDPVEGITDSSPGRDYLEVMRANLTALRKANQCS